MSAALNLDCALRYRQILRIGSYLLLDPGHNFMSRMLMAMNHEQALASQAVGAVSENNCANHCAEEISSSACADLGLVQPQSIGAGEHAANGSRKGNLQAIEHPGDAQGGHDQPVPSAPWQAIQAGRDISLNDPRHSL